MTFAHEAIAALPTLTAADKALVRAMTTRRFAYCLAASESATNFIAVDSDTGALPLYLLQGNALFQYDATDSTTANDGVTCLVTSDGKRYKAASVAYPWAVLDKDLVAQPVSPSVGDAYLLPTAATGTDWAGKDGEIAIYSAAGWRFAIVPVGRFLYVKDETAFYHRNTSGVWTAGVGSLVLSANSVPMSALIGAGASFLLKVENQTTNAQPVSATVGVAYIIGPSPTGAIWAGNAGKVAICEVTNSFTVYTPSAGDEVYDKALGVKIRRTASAWESAFGAWRTRQSQFTATGSTSSISGSSIAPSDTVPPTQSNGSVKDTVIITAAAPTGSKLRFIYFANVSVNGSGEFQVALFRDTVSASIAWRRQNFAISISNVIACIFETTTPDGDPHDYHVRVMNSTDPFNATSLARRLFSVEAAS